MRSGRRSTHRDFSGNWTVLASLLPYFMEFRGRVLLALCCLVLAKLATVTVPFAMKNIVDALDSSQTALVAVPMAFLLFYGLLRFSAIILGELRDTLFGRVTERAMRRIGLKVFQHLHALELEFHLSRRTGGLSRDIERGTTGISFIMRFMLFNILPTLLEIGLVCFILLFNYGVAFALVIVVSITAYVGFSIVMTERRTRLVRLMNEMDDRSTTRAVDSLLNFETVKYFNNEAYEAQEYDENLADWEQARRNNRLSLAALNAGQSLIVATAITMIMIIAAQQVVANTMTLGDLVMVNAYMLQLFLPLNFLGFVYREIKKALADVEHMFALLEKKPQIRDRADARELIPGGSAICFEQVDFFYQVDRKDDSKDDRKILDNVSFSVPAGRKVAIVGPSGAGKSTIMRLLFRFYDIHAGIIKIDEQDIRTLTQHSLRRAIGVVPQDTVLFNNTIYYNIAYGNPQASAQEIDHAIRMAHLDSFIEQLPEGLDTMVGERGLKVSGGEKQRIAIARMLLKRPAIMIFDEATSSLDSAAEQAILTALKDIAKRTTTLMIAHRLSTVIDADAIIVLRHGRVVEQGEHKALLKQKGVYARMWALQKQEG